MTSISNCKTNNQGALYKIISIIKPKSVIRVYGRLVFVSSRLAASLAKVRKASSECLSATARQGCGQDAERNADMAKTDFKKTRIIEKSA